MPSALFTTVTKSFLALCAICIIYSNLSFYEIYSEERATLSTLRRAQWSTMNRLQFHNFSSQVHLFINLLLCLFSSLPIDISNVAVVYAGPTFHDEVASVAACILHDLGYYVVVYIGNGIHFGGMMVPFSGKRKRLSQEFYGRCVSQFVTISTPVKYVTDPDIMVFVTYPMMEHAGLPDKYALSLLRKLHSDSATTSVVMITHRTNELIHDMMKEVENIIPRQQITYMLLGEHTQKSAEAIISKYDSTTDPKSRIITVGDPKSFHLSHFYPVLPIEYVVQQDHLPKRKIIDISNSRFPVFKEVNNHDDDNEKKTANISNNMKAVEKNFELRNHDKKAEKDSYHPTFVIQGNFGGKHSHRKDLLGTLNCLRAIEDKIMKGKTVLSNTKTTKNDAISEHKMLKTNSSANTRPNSVINYGNTTMKSIKRRLRKDTSAIEKRFLSEDNTEIGKHHKYNPAAQSSESLSIDLIGHLNGKVDVGTLRTGAVRFLSDLSSKNYYSSISQARFLVSGIGEEEYYTSRATSSIPAALIAHVPLVTSQEFLNIYPCLRDAPIHRKMARGDGIPNIPQESGNSTTGSISESSECSAMNVAVKLSEEEYSAAKKEIEECSAILWKQAKESFHLAAARNVKFKSRDPHPHEGHK